LLPAPYRGIRDGFASLFLLLAGLSRLALRSWHESELSGGR
jgi:hypothetical protein